MCYLRYSSRVCLLISLGNTHVADTKACSHLFLASVRSEPFQGRCDHGIGGARFVPRATCLSNSESTLSLACFKLTTMALHSARLQPQWPSLYLHRLVVESAVLGPEIICAYTAASRSPRNTDDGLSPSGLSVDEFFLTSPMVLIHAKQSALQHAHPSLLPMLSS